MNTVDLIAQLQARLLAETEEKTVLGRWLALLVARLGGTVVLDDAPESGEYHMMTNHRCGPVHGSRCSDTLVLHDGPPDTCRTLLCVEFGAAAASQAAAARPRTRAEEQLLAAEGRQRRPELN